MADTRPLDLRMPAYGVAYATYAIGLVASIVRLYSRGFVQKTWGLDDYFAVAVVIVNVGQLAVLQMLLNINCGLPMAIECSFQAEPLFRIALLEEIVLYTVHFIIKMTFLTFYLRLSPQLWFLRATYGGIAFNLVIYLGSMLITLLQCTPFDAIAHPMLYPDRDCLSQFVVMLIPPVLNIVMDVYILALPIGIIVRLNMSLRRRVGVLVIVSSGLASLIVACIRIPLVFRLTSSPDTSYELGKMIIAAALEIQFAVVAVSMPSFMVLTSSWRKGRKRASRAAYDGGIELFDSGHQSTLRAAMGTITRLERDLPTGESKDKLCLSSADTKRFS
ncbi:alpha-methylacyl-CoA racemase [Microdochium nivale]|nr:alpha-methylacyl-CoA racemase [Microdochium nivale]